jgi:hypothetical protein
MYLRRTERRTNAGGVGYLQLAHNEWDPVAKQSKVRVIYNFGREDQLDREAIVRLIGSLQRALEPEQAVRTAAAPTLRFVESRPMGGAWALDGLWRRLAVDRTLRGLIGHPGVASTAAGEGQETLPPCGGPKADWPLPAVVRCRQAATRRSPVEGLVYEVPQRYLLVGAL